LWTFWKVAIRIKVQVRFDVSPSNNAVGFSIFQSPLLFCTINYAKIINASIRRSCQRSGDETWDNKSHGKSREKTKSQNN